MIDATTANSKSQNIELERAVKKSILPLPAPAHPPDLGDGMGQAEAGRKQFQPASQGSQPLCTLVSYAEIPGAESRPSGRTSG